MELYGDGAVLRQVHPDPLTNCEIWIGELCAKLDIARQVLAAVSAMQVVSPALVELKRQAVWALEETRPTAPREKHQTAVDTTPPQA